MTVHQLILPDMKKGDSLVAMFWDDDAGTVGGEHSDVPILQQIFDEKKPYIFGDASGSWELKDPAHSVEEMNVIIRAGYQHLVDDSESLLPPAFRGLEPPEPQGAERLYDDDGNLMT